MAVCKLVLVITVASAVTAQALPSAAWGLWNKETLFRETGNTINSDMDIAIAPDGTVGAVFMDGNIELHYASRTTLGWTDEIVPGGRSSPTLAYDSASNPHIVSDTSSGLMHSTKSGGVWTSVLAGIPNTPNPNNPHFKIDATGRFHVAYASGSSTHYATMDPATSEWTNEVVSNGNSIYTDIALDTQGVPHIAFGGDGFDFHLYYASKSGGGWVVETVADYCDTDIALAIDAQDRPHISCHRGMGNPYGGLAYATKINGAWTIEVADNSAGGLQPQNGQFVGFETDIAASAGGTPHIAYYVQLCCGHAANHLHYATKTDTGWKVEIVDRTSGRNGGESAIAVSSEGGPHILYEANPEIACSCEEARYATPLAPWALPT